MRLIFVSFLLVFLVDQRVSAEISSESCALLRTLTSLTKIVPEVFQLALRSFRSSLIHQREKRFIRSTNLNLRGSMIEQVIANTIRDVNFTSVALLMLENNETMNKIQENVDIDAVIRTIVRGIDQEKLAIGFFNAASKEFDLEYFVANLINRTNLEKLHDDLLINGTLPEWLLKSFHPDLNQRVFQRFISTIKNFTTKLFMTIRKNEQQQNFFFKILLDKSLSSMKNFVDKLQRSNAKTFDEFFESFANKTNDLIFETNLSVGQRPITTSTKKPIDDNDDDDNVDPSEAIFQWSIVFNAIGETSHVFLKSFEQLFCQIE